MPTYGAPVRLVTMMKRMWDEKPAQRPDFQEIVDVLIEVNDAMPRSHHTNQLQSGTSGDALDDLLGK